MLGVPKLGVELPNSPLEGKGVEPNKPPEELAAEAVQTHMTDCQ